MKLRFIFNILAIILIAVTLGALPLPAMAATRVTNVATATWGSPGTSQSIESNAVITEIESLPPATIETYRPDPGAGTLVTIPTGGCQSASLPSLRLAARSDTTYTSAIAPTGIVHAGDPLIFRINAPAANLDPSAVDSLIVVLTTTSGDRETVTVVETGPDTGEFVGLIGTTGNSVVRSGDCLLSLNGNDRITVTAEPASGQGAYASATVTVLLDPSGFVVDSGTGAPVSGVRVSLVDADTGLPATVQAPGGATWPATVTTGQAVTDGAGIGYPLQPGEFSFPQVAPGRYRLIVTPPSPYTAPSTTTDAQLAGLTRPDGTPLILVAGSRGEVFTVTGPDAVHVDIPVDRPTTPLTLTKVASRATAVAGDQIVYSVTLTNPDAGYARRGVTLTDALPSRMRLNPGSVRIDGVPAGAAATVTADGRRLTVALGTLAAGGAHVVTYVLAILPDAPAGQAINKAVVSDARGISTTATAVVTVTSDVIASRMTIVGRIAAGPCATDAARARGIGGVRVMLEDGSYAITDSDGRYHFEGVVPGSHVVAVDSGTLGQGGTFVDCTRSTRSAGSAISRFVEGQGGQLVIADFQAILPPVDAAAAEPDPAIPAPVSDKAAAGGERDWFANGAADIAWLFPEPDYNPRQPATRIAIRHLVGQTAALLVGGKPVDTITFDGTRSDPAKTFTVSLWRGVPLAAGANRFTVIVRNADGTIAATLERTVYFTTTAARAQYLPARSRLVADGVRRPVIAVRITDRNGRPVRAGTTGDLSLSAPYETAMAVDADQARALSGLERAAPVWRVTGDDGIAYIELAPTTTSGALTLDFAFRDRDQVRRQKVDAWLSPGDRPWTIVGLAEGRAGFGKLASHVEPAAIPTEEIGADGRVAFYAKGRIKGSWLLTLAYDSAKRRSDQQLSGVIDPNTYYTVYADRSERRFDAASTRKIYIKLETRQFYALFGDFETNFVDTQLARYVRSATGAKTEYRGKNLAGAAFVARFPTTHRRESIQGSGLSAGYVLGSRDILANSEQVTVEVRDRLRPDRVIEQRTLTRFVDYDIDYAAGTLRLSSPLLSRSSSFDPQFLVVDYEVTSASGGDVNAGARLSWTSNDEALRIGVTGLRDAGDNGRTVLGAADLRWRIGSDIEVRGEIAGSRRDGSNAVKAAWLVELEHHSTRLDLLAYARSAATDYGVGQQNAVDLGRRRIGLDLRYRLTERLSLSTSAWLDSDLAGGADRTAARTRLDFTGAKSDFHLGMTYAHDRTGTDSSLTSTLLDAGATRRLLGGRLELDASASVALGKAESVDFPAQYRLGARFQVSPDVTLDAAYEIARGDGLDARTARVGFDLKPWAGARLTSGLGAQDTGEYGRRAFAAYGLAQSFQLGKKWSIDATLDGSRTLSGIDAAKVLVAGQPAASGGYVGSGNLITEDFTAVTLGATYRTKFWSGTARAEYRFGSLGDRSAFTAGLIRRLGEGSAFGALATWTHAEQIGGATTGTLDLAVSGAYRPAASRVAMLGKLSWIEDNVTNAVAGAAGPVAGSTLTVTGDAHSRRAVGSLSIDWAPRGRDAKGYFQRSEVSLFLGARYVVDRIDSYDIAGLSTMAGIDARIGLGDKVEMAVSATMRAGPGMRSIAYAYGPSIGVRPARDMLVTVGWNVRGFDDRDFAGARTTRAGPFVALKIKFDQRSFAFLGLDRR
ncbi:MAG TPA: hypothetical protein VF409_01830 [Sphingomonas sp.]